MRWWSSKSDHNLILDYWFEPLNGDIEAEDIDFDETPVEVLEQQNDDSNNFFGVQVCLA